MPKKKPRQKCPHCNSTRITFNDKEEMHCKKCGFVNSKSKETKLIGFKEAGKADDQRQIE
ncbi:hypothetical protein GF378_01880 [Candidatus Pacearchaeota archaeon]|nr:hypothetical protein [Candidatus Pacearchaeota archaeon]